MNKNVYSIVLTDEVIRAVDERAYLMGTNRSNLINQVLAEYFSCVTPEMRMKSILDSVLSFMGAGSFPAIMNSDSVLTVKSGLEFKYRPTINYRIELERVPEKYLGKLKIGIRTQNMELITLFEHFFRFIAPIEAALLEKYGCGGYKCEFTKAGFVRYVINHSSTDDKDIGGIIGEYIKLLNNAVKMYFSAPDCLEEIAVKYGTELGRLFEKNII